MLDRPDTTQSSEKANSAVSHLGYDLVEEIVRLFGRMEDDRLVTQKMLSSERKKVERLRTKIDQLAFKRLVELPVAIQTGMNKSFKILGAVLNVLGVQYVSYSLKICFDKLNIIYIHVVILLVANISL